MQKNKKEIKKNGEDIFRFWDNSIWKCCNKLPQLWREYLSSGVNGLTNSLKILHFTNPDFLHLNINLSDQ